MIVPWIKGFLTWRFAPVTWTLIVLNLLIFLHTFENTNRSVSRDFSNVEMLVLTGKLYSQYQNPQKKELPIHSENEWLILGGQGLKDPVFIENAERFQFFGDQIAIESWKEKIDRYRDQLKERATYVFGLRSPSGSPLTWITYQFMHASWMHLFGNMMMFLIFGAALEVTIGSLGLIFVYVFGGIAGAWFFQFLSIHSLAPMVGASGSLSAVMAFYAAFEKKKRVSFFYFLSPFPGYFGWIYLPTFIIFPLCFLSDLAGYLSTPSEIGAGVAYAAHMGGVIFGASLGFSLRSFRKNLWVQWFFQH